MWLFNKIDGDHLEAQGEIQVYDRVRFEDVRRTEIRKESSKNNLNIYPEFDWGLIR